jgi:hypothetical protein
MSNEAVSRKAQQQSDLSQVMSHGPALCAAYGRFWGAVIMMLAITKARRGPLGIAAGVTFFGYGIYRIWSGH